MMVFFQEFMNILDSVLIFFYRIPDVPIAGYLLGTFVLALFCVVIGQLTISVAFLTNRRRIDADNRNMVRMQNLSVKALAAKNKGAYKAFNKEANEAFGKVFFMQIALAAASLWPVPFALAWMQTRFSGVEFPLPFTLPMLGGSVGYTFSFFPILILAFILFGKVKRYLPYFNRIHGILKGYDKEKDDMITFADLHPPQVRS